MKLLQQPLTPDTLLENKECWNKETFHLDSGWSIKESNSSSVGKPAGNTLISC